MLAEHGYKVRRDRHPPDVLSGSVLQTAVVVGLPRVGPLSSDRWTRSVEQSASPALGRQDQVRLGEADRFSRPETTEVHRGEETHQAPTASTPVATHVGGGRQEIPSLLGVRDNARGDLVGDLRFLPADGRDRVFAQLPQVDRIIGGIDERPSLTSHGLGCRGVPSSLSFSESRTARAVAGSARSASGRDAFDTR